MEFEVKPIFKGKMSDLPVPIATTLHHSFTRGFCNAGNFSLGRSKRQSFGLPLLLVNKITAIRNAWGTGNAVRWVSSHPSGLLSFSSASSLKDKFLKNRLALLLWGLSSPEEASNLSSERLFNPDVEKYNQF